MQKEKEHNRLYSFSILIDYLSDEVFSKVAISIEEDQVQIVGSLTDARLMTGEGNGIGNDGNVIVSNICNARMS